MRQINSGLAERFSKWRRSDSRLEKWGPALSRTLLNDAQWERIAPLLPGKKDDPGRSGEDNRRFIEAVLWLAHTDAPWRDLPKSFGKWYWVWKRFRDGHSRACSSGFSQRCRKISISNTRSSTARSSRFTGTAPVQKGDSKSGYRQIARRTDDQDCRRRAGQLGALCPATRPT